MSLLQVRDCPDELYEMLAQVAQSENRSIAQQTIILLRKALHLKESRMARRQSTFKAIDDLKLTCSRGFPDPADLIREDRER
jgi:hypothetical protein